MQSFASPHILPHSHPHTNPPTPQKSRTTNQTPQIKHHILYHAPTKRVQLSPILTPFLPKNPQKGRNYRLYPRPFYQKNTERAHLSLILTPFLPKNHRKGATIACFGEKYYYLCKKQINHNYYDKQRINRKSL